MLKPGYKQTDLGVLPQEWEVKPLNEVSPRIQVGLVINPSTYFEKDGVIPMLTARNIAPHLISAEDASKISIASNELLHSTQIHMGDVVVVRVGYPGTAAVVPEKLDGINCASLIIIRTGKFNSDFLCYCINSEIGQNQVEQASYGSAQKCFNIGDAVKLLVPFPPVEEQQAIAEALGAVDALLTSQQQLLAKKRALKLATQQALLSGERRLPGFAGEWEELSLIDFVRLSKKRMNPHTTANSYRCVEMEHIAPESGSLLSFTDSKLQASIKSFFEPGDILFGKLRPYLRKYYLADFNGVCSTEFWVIKPLENSLSEYIYQLVQSDQFVEAANQTTGTKMPRANWSDMRELTFFLPPLAEQRAIATILSDMDAELEALAAQLAKTQALKQGLMQDLLTGTIRLTAGAAPTPSHPTP